MELQQPSRDLTPLTGHTNLVQETPLVIGSRKVKGEATGPARRRHRPDPAGDAETQQQTSNVVDKHPTGRGVVDAATATVRAHRDRTTGGPELAQEERDLPLGE